MQPNSFNSNIFTMYHVGRVIISPESYDPISIHLECQSQKSGFRISDNHVCVSGVRNGTGECYFHDFLQAELMGVSFENNRQEALLTSCSSLTSTL